MDENATKPIAVYRENALAGIEQTFSLYDRRLDVVVYTRSKQSTQFVPIPLDSVRPEFGTLNVKGSRLLFSFGVLWSLMMIASGIIHLKNEKTTNGSVVLAIGVVFFWFCVRLLIRNWRPLEIVQFFTMAGTVAFSITKNHKDAGEFDAFVTSVVGQIKIGCTTQLQEPKKID